MHDKCTGQMHDACQQRFVIAICDHNQMVLGALRVMYKSLIVHSIWLGVSATGLYVDL